MDFAETSYVSNKTSDLVMFRMKAAFAQYALSHILTNPSKQKAVTKYCLYGCNYLVVSSHTIKLGKNSYN